MTNKVTSLLLSGTANEIVDALRAGLAGAAPRLLGVFASPKVPLGELLPALARTFPAATVIGASSAGELIETGDAHGSVSVFALEGDFAITAGLGTGLRADPEGAVTRALASVTSDNDGYAHRTAILLLDPLSGNGEEATLLAGALLGAGVRLAGGAAGDDLAMASTTVGLGGEVASDALVIALVHSRSPLGVGVCHGHTALSGPLRVTKAEGNTVHTLDGHPAWDIWKRETRAHAGALGIDVDALGADDEGAYLLRYEAGLRSGGELKVRAPLRRTGGSIHFATAVPEGATLRITESTAQAQIDSARTAAERARAQLDGKPVAGALLFDCICRKLILGDAFAGALRGVSHALGDAPLAGFETYGEIALDVGDMSGFHNTTSVVLAFPVE